MPLKEGKARSSWEKPRMNSRPMRESLNRRWKLQRTLFVPKKYNGREAPARVTINANAVVKGEVEREAE